MKKLLAFAILFIFLFLLGGRIVLYEALTIENRSSILESIQNGSVKAKEITISIDQKDAGKFIDRNEITYNDHRYDITKTEIKGDKILVHAINDAEEEKLMAGMNDIYFNSNHQPLNHRNALNLLDDFFKEYTSGHMVNIIPDPTPVIITNHSSNLFILKGFQSLVIPPPKS